MAQVRDAGVHADAIDPRRCLTLATKAGKGLPQVQRHLLKEVADAFIVSFWFISSFVSFDSLLYQSHEKQKTYIGVLLFLKTKY